MKELKLDLSESYCHSCGNIMRKDIKNKTERCVHFACLIRNIDFSIPVIQEKKG